MVNSYMIDLTIDDINIPIIMIGEYANNEEVMIAAKESLANEMDIEELTREEKIKLINIKSVKKIN